MKNLSRLLPFVAALLVLCPDVAVGQGATVSGVVQEATTSRPVIGALVTVGSLPDARTTRTDELGGFNFSNLQSGSYPLTVRGVGYIALEQTITVDREIRLNITLTRFSALDTVRVRQGAQAIYGVVATANLTPLANATVQIYGVSVGQTTTDAAGKFYYDIKSPGAYIVRGKSSGLGTASVSVTVPPKNRVEVALILDTTQISGANALEMAYGDFRDRMLRRGMNSVLVPRTELVERNGGKRGVISALMTSQTFAAKGLRFTDVVCLFVDGIPQPGRNANAISAESVESVEAYGPTGDRSQTLSRRFPASGNCGDTGLPRVMINPSGGPRPDVVKWLVVWLKH
ncbi:MAG: carboxypeptidase regulatory-like domain-containing protein [Gemmatimonas sp.]